MISHRCSKEAEEPVVACLDVLPIDEGGVAQTMVRCNGGGGGAVTYTGVSSWRSYRVARDECFWVRNEDLPGFRLRPSMFSVLDETRIDPAERERERQIASLEQRFDERLSEFARWNTGVTRPAERRRPGRPRISDAELDIIGHLRWHRSHPWSVARLAAKFIGPESLDPKGAIRMRLSRLLQAHPNFKETKCRFCKTA
jgi:hypothetical protein